MYHAAVQVHVIGTDNKLVATQQSSVNYGVYIYAYGNYTKSKIVK